MFCALASSAALKPISPKLSSDVEEVDEEDELPLSSGLPPSQPRIGFPLVHGWSVHSSFTPRWIA